MHTVDEVMYKNYIYITWLSVYLFCVINFTIIVTNDCWQLIDTLFFSVYIMLYLCIVMEKEYRKPINISLKRKIANRSKEIVEYEYCYLHEGDKYVVIDASYVFNKCSHDNYYANLRVTAAKIKMLNETAPFNQIVEALEYVMFNASKSVYYPTVTIFEARDIVSSIWNVNPDKVERFVYGDDVVDSEHYEDSRQYSKVYNYRSIEWKPSVAEIIKLTDKEKSEYESINDKVKAHNYLVAIKTSKKSSYSSRVRNESIRATIDSIVHSTKQALDEETTIGDVTREMLYKLVREQIDISEYMFLQSLKRLKSTGSIADSYAPNKIETMVKGSEEKIIKAGYEIHKEKELINKYKVQKKTDMSNRTINKRWSSVEPTFNQLNKQLNIQ